MVQVIGEVGALKNFQQYLALNGFGVVTLGEYYDLIKTIEKEKDIYIGKINKFKETQIYKLKTLKGSLENEIKILENILLGEEENTGLLGWVKMLQYKFKVKKEILSKKNILQKIEMDISTYENNTSSLLPEDLKNNYNYILNKEKLLIGARNFYYGALGEVKIKNLLSRISINSFLINDFDVSFEKPISMKGGGDWIYSIQIDHILINEMGIFLIETKNRSKEMKEHHNFSPTYQTKRHGHGFYWYYKDKIFSSIRKNVRIYNILVMEGKKVPNETLGVYILNPSEIRRFIETRNLYFTKTEVEKLKFLLSNK